MVLQSSCMTNDPPPTISIVIPARNEENDIERLLNSIESNEYTNYEVVVVDGNSNDRTREVARSFGARVIEGPCRGPAVARNIGWRNADGEWIMFLDADWRLKENALQKIAQHAHPDIDTMHVSAIHDPDGWVSQTVSVENRFNYLKEIKNALGI